MCEKEIQLIAIICLFDFVCGTQNLVSSFDFQEGHLDNPVIYLPRPYNTTRSTYEAS